MSNTTKRRWIKIKKRMFEKQKYCYLCGGFMTKWPTFEHIVPKHLCHSNRQDNLALSCQLCNEKRGPMTMAQFRHSQYLPFEIEWIK